MYTCLPAISDVCQARCIHCSSHHYCPYLHLSYFHSARDPLFFSRFFVEAGAPRAGLTVRDLTRPVLF